MIEDEIRQEISETQAKRFEEQLLFPKEEWDSLIKWSPVSNIDEIYENLPKAKRYHDNYVRLWNLKSR